MLAEGGVGEGVLPTVLVVWDGGGQAAQYSILLKSFHHVVPSGKVLEKAILVIINLAKLSSGSVGGRLDSVHRVKVSTDPNPPGLVCMCVWVCE